MLAVQTTFYHATFRNCTNLKELQHDSVVCSWSGHAQTHRRISLARDRATYLIRKYGRQSTRSAGAVWRLRVSWAIATRRLCGSDSQIFQCRAGWSEQSTVLVKVPNRLSPSSNCAAVRCENKLSRLVLLAFSFQISLKTDWVRWTNLMKTLFPTHS